MKRCVEENSDWSGTNYIINCNENCDINYLDKKKIKIKF